MSSQTACPPQSPPSPAAHCADTEALLRLACCPGSAGMRRLLHHADPAEALAAGPSLWRACGLTPLQQARLHRPEEATLQRARQWLLHPGNRLLGWHQADYPSLLRRGANPPAVLFVAGDAGLLWQPAVAVVGSRSPSPQGLENARVFAATLVRAGFAVASGMAAGIDAVAHQAALDAGGGTFAVLGTGPDVAYPRRNTALHARLRTRGALVSEHPPGTGPRTSHFPSRNRIIAALALGTVVVEAAGRSGALITARLAAECGREVMALPGSIHNPSARGCHRLIRDGAALVEDPGEVVELLQPVAHALAGDLRRRLAAPTHEVDPSSGAPGGTGPDDPSRRLWDVLGHDPVGMDQLVARSGLTPAEASSMLLALELDGRVAARHGRWYRIG